MAGLTFTRTAQKQLAAIPPNQRAVIIEKIGQLASNAAALANVLKQLKGRPEMSLRVGDYRVLYVERAEVIEVRAVAHRRDAYR